jgi:ATP-dependent DNA helicase RecQ
MSDKSTDAALRKTLRETFGLKKLRPGQREVIESVLNGRDTLAIMPTGAGKSLCYQLPALQLPGQTVVVSPLIALMRDQAEKLDEAGVEASQVNSTLRADEEAQALDDIRAERSEVVFTTPERLAKEEFLATLKRNRIDFLVVDEAHCISQWGHDFRPAFLEIGRAAEALGRPPILALTATATPAVVEDIRARLGRPGMQVFRTGIYRENLDYAVIPVTNDEEKRRALLDLVARQKGSGIVYAATVKAAVEVHAALKAAGIDAALYHGRLSAKDRHASQDLFMGGKARVMVATNAFGMGIDKPDIRFVVHCQLPATLEAYYQESGRAGRDGERADCVLVYDSRDRRIQQFFLARKRKRSRDKDLAPEQRQGLEREHARRLEFDRERLERMVFYAQTAFCRWKVLLSYFEETAAWSGPAAGCGHCDNCRRPREAVPEPRQRHAPAPPPPALKHAIEPGTLVCVPRYGEGRVAEAAGDQVTVEFPDGASRRFIDSVVSPADPPRRVNPGEPECSNPIHPSGAHACN